jgi:hypothetical protein
VTLLLAFLAGAAWRRWFGSARPDWAFPGYRGMQVCAGIGVCSLIAGASVLALACAALAVGWMTLPISVSRQPFVALLDRSPWLPTLPYLRGSAEWGEFLQGACLFTAAALAAQLLKEIV